MLVLIFVGHSAGSETSTTPSWTNPASIAVEKGGSTSNSQNTSNFLPNLDCQLVSFRYVASKQMEGGCFTEMAFGMMDADTSTVIFNDTDEGIKITPYSTTDGLIPWPRSSNVIALTAVNTGGTYANIYKNPLNSIVNQRNILGQLIGKKITQPADMPLRDNLGNRLVLNPQTIGFSPNGSWLVAETLTGSFIRINLVTLDVVPFAKSYGATGNPALLKTPLSVTDDGRFIVLSNNEASEFKVFDLDTCAGIISGTKALECSSYDYFSRIKQTAGSIKYISRVRFIMDDLISFDLNSGVDTAGWLLAPTKNIDFKSDYLAMGDSYTSGEGAFDYILGTDTEANMCHLSKRSYPHLIINDLFGQRGGNSVACSGAVIWDIGSRSDNYRGQVKDILDFRSLKSSQPSLLEAIMANHLPGYIAQHRYITDNRPRIISVSIGGNDIGFGDMLRSCVMPRLRPGSNNNCYNSFEDQLEIEQLIQRTEIKWTALFKQLKEESVRGEVYAIGYPSVSNPEGKCALNVHLSQQELTLTENIISYLNEAIARSANNSGVNYVDISDALIGHRFCEATSSQTAMNGLTAGKDAGIKDLKFFGKESYHPNQLGHRLIEQAVLKKTNNFTAPSPRQPDNTKIAAGNSSGRKLYKIMPATIMSQALINRGGGININISDSILLKPNSLFDVRIGSSSGAVIGTLTSDVHGGLAGSVVVPDTYTGGQTIHVTGPDILDTASDIFEPVFIPASENDGDGDGTDDSIDTCPGASNSGVDDDKDGIDDVCTSSGATPGQTTPDATDDQSSENTQTLFSKNSPDEKSQGTKKQLRNVSRTKILSNRPGMANSTQINPAQLLAARTNWQVLPSINWRKILAITYLVVIFGYLAKHLIQLIYTKVSQ